MARKPYVPLKEQEDICKNTGQSKCDPKDRNVRAMVSKEEGNSIQQRPDGLYAPAVIYRENTSVEAADDSVSVEEGLTEEGYRAFAVGTRISTESGNQLVLREDGLFVMVDIPDASRPILLHQGSLIYNPLIPGTGVISYEHDRNVIRVVDGLSRLVLGLAEPFERMEELYLVQDGQRNLPMVLEWPAGVMVDNVPGPSSRSFRPGGSVHLLRHQGQQWLILAGLGVDEAPIDGQPYTRKNGIWVQQHAQVLPALVLGEPDDPQPMPVTNAQFNRIVHVHDEFESLQLYRQHIQNYVEDFEATYTKPSSFLVLIPMGVRVNGFPGPLAFRVEAKPRGCVLKKIGYDDWLLLGSVIQDGTVPPLPEIVTLEFPGSGAFQAVFRMLDGTLLYDMSTNSNMISSVHRLKNLIIGALILENRTPMLDAKEVVYNSAYKTGVAVVSQSPLQDGDVISWRDILSLLLHEGWEDIAVMVSDLLGSGDHEAFTSQMNLFIAGIETPLVSSFYGAAVSIANPVGISNARKMADWLQYIEEHYEIMRSLLRLVSRSFNIFGPDPREYATTNQDIYMDWSRVDYGGKSDLETLGQYPNLGLVKKLEMPADLPVYVSMHDFPTELERHLAFTTGLMSVEDDFTFLSHGESDFDTEFSDVVLLLGNSAALVDRSNIQNQVNVSPTGTVNENRSTKGWTRSWSFNGSVGYVSVYDNPSLRLADDDFTIELFIRATNKTNFTIFAKDGPNLNQKSFKLQVVGNNLVFTYLLDGETEVRTWTMAIGTIKALLFNGSRRHICLQRSGDDLAFFINGRLFGTMTLAVAGAEFQDCALPFNIACDGDPLGSVAPTTGYYGQFRLDNLRITRGQARYPMEGFPVRTRPFRTGSGA